MDEIFTSCIACLSKDRKLTPVSELRPLIRAISFWELSSIQDGVVCWECHHRMLSFNSFKNQVQQVIALLRQGKVPKDIKTFSKLSVTNLPEYNTYINHETDSTNYLQNEFHDNIVFTMETDTNPEENVDAFTTTKLEIKVEEEIDSDEEITHEEELFHEIRTFEAKPVSLEIQNLKKIKKKNVSKVKKLKEEVTAEEMEKFTTVMFTEEELFKIREEKRNQPNYKKIPFKCDSCVLGFTRKDTFDLHMEKKHDKKNGPHQCDVCHIRFQTSKQMSRHKSKHYLTYRCKLCKYESGELWSMQTHSRTKHSEDRPERIHCGCCPFVAKSPEELTLHMRSEHCVYCSECGEKFKALGTLKSHLRRIHRVKREFICDLCKKPFKTKSRLESHMVRHNSTLAKNLAYCSPCDIQYKNIYVYRHHLRTSANHAVQTYECPDCHKRFASKTYWKKHCNFFHLHKSQYCCELCNKLFISDWKLKCHRQTQHGLNRTRDHHCSICGKQFYTLSTLKGHQLTHSQLRSYMCEDCGDTFKQRPALYNHYKLVHRRIKRTRAVT